MIPDSTLPERLVGRLSSGGVAIFLFHGVIPRQRQGVRNYTAKHIEADLFASCIRELTTSGAPLSMDDVLAYSRTDEPYPPRAFVVTFDDGFENNVSVAAPILADFKVPATIYVTTGFVESNEMSWIDRIEYAVEGAPNQILSVAWADGAFPLRDEATRIEFLEAVRAYVKSEPLCDANKFADELCGRLGAAAAPVRDEWLDSKLTWDQVRQANEHYLFSIGGHSHTHPILSFLSPDGVRDEIETSLCLLREKAGVAPTHYSYPEGLEHCYSGAVIRELRRQGVQCCPTAIDGVNRRGDNLFHLKRVMVGGSGR